jgi:hypothetical protein
VADPTAIALLSKVKRNVAKMAAQNAPAEDINGYIASEGVTVDEVRNFQSAPPSKEAMAFDPGREMDKEGYAVRPKKSKTTSFIEGAGNNITLGFGDEIAALPISMLKGQTYDDTLNKIHVQQREAKADNPKTYLGGQVAGSIAQGVALAPLSATARGYQAGAGMTKLMGLSGLDAAVLGGLAGVGEGEGLEDRAKKGATGAVIGGATGLVSPLATSLLGTGYQGLKGLIGVGNLDRAKQAIAQTLLRSGKPAQDVVNDITQAGAEGQGMYALADALGYEGQRRLSGVTRIPGPQRNKVVEALDARQDDHALRVIDTLKEGMGTAQGTALKKAAADKATRRMEGNLNYKAARDQAGAVDVSAALKDLDDRLTPGVTAMMGTGAGAETGVFNKLARARELIGGSGTQVSNFDRALAAKIEMDDIIEGGGPAAALLKPARDKLDDALAQSSAPYAQARDTYRLQSEGIEAIEKGTTAAKGGLTADTTSLFGGLKPHEVPGFRQGYVDPLIERAERAAETVNVARPLTSLKRKVELPAFAAPGQGDKMVRKIGRENEMFKTREQAIGGSATAQNLADNADTSDVGMLVNLLTNPKAAVAQGAAQLLAGAQGLNETTRGFMADMLMESNPVVVQGLLKAAQKSGKDAVAARALLNMLFNQAGPRVATPFVEPMLRQQQ